MLFERKIKKKVIPFVENILPLQVEKISIMSFREILSKLNNRYVYATLVFLVVMLFIDPFNIFEQFRLDNQLKDKKQQIEYYEAKNKECKEYGEALLNDTATMEKVAREQYLMKRDNEVIYLIETQE